MSDLLVALQDLRNGSSSLRTRCQEIRERPAPKLGRLVAVAESLARPVAARNLPCPQEYVSAWNDRKNRRGFVLPRRAIRFLHWEPSVVLDPQFHYQLDAQQHISSARDIQGLVRACHVQWLRYAADDHLQRLAKRRLREYEGANRIVNKWKGAVSTVLGTDGPQIQANSLIDRQCSPQDVAADWSLEEMTPFLVETVRCALSTLRATWATDSTLAEFAVRVLLPWEGWSRSDVKSEVGVCILHRDATVSAIKKSLTHFVVSDSRFGDPRRSDRRPNWLGVQPDAVRRVIEWLSGDDIVFFFDHAFPRGGDPHGRKTFWLRYVSRVVMSRPLFCWEDLSRLRPIARQLRADVGNFGTIDGKSSAFVLDFGEVCAIEFNRVGACYVFPRAVMPHVIKDLWSEQQFRSSALRRRDLLPDPDSHRIEHRSGWEDKMRRLLAQYKVRQG